MLRSANKYLIGLRISSVAPAKKKETVVNLKLHMSTLRNARKASQRVDDTSFQTVILVSVKMADCQSVAMRKRKKSE